MKKIIGIVLLIVAIVLIIVFVVKRNSGDTSTVSNQPEDTTSSGESAISGTVSYEAQKVFFEKPTEVVVGTTPDINGTITYTNGSLRGDVSIPTTNLKTNSDRHDNDVRELLGETIRVNVPEIKISFPAENVSVPVSFTINDVTREEIFTVTGSQKDNRLALSGETTIVMSNYSINPPSLAKIYTVEDDIVLKFDIVVK